MPAEFCYGERDQKLVHISDLDPAIDRGFRCRCICPECKRALQAHLGNKKAWHFQHEQDDINCNPQPMTLLHAYVRDQFAELEQITIPSGKLTVTAMFREDIIWEEIEVSKQAFEITEAHTEYRIIDVQPDVLLKRADDLPVAIEVKYSHAVNEKKKIALKHAISYCAEFDVSDLPSTGIGKSDFSKIINEKWRWSWITHGEGRLRENRLHDRLSWTCDNWKPNLTPRKVPKPAPSASAKLSKAQRILLAVDRELKEIRSRKLDHEEMANWLGQQSREKRLAIACTILGLEPESMPPHFTQSIGMGLQNHPYAWQLVIFMKFGVGKRSFSSDEAEAWLNIALPELAQRYPEELSKNGFSRTRATLHEYFLHLEAQQFLSSDQKYPKTERVFHPVFRRLSEFQSFLKSKNYPVKQTIFQSNNEMECN